MFSCEICNISKKTLFFTDQRQWLLLRFISCFERSPEQLASVEFLQEIPDLAEKVFAAAKILKQPLQVFGKRKSANLIWKSFIQYCKAFKSTYFEDPLWTAVSETQHLSDKFTEGK